MVDIERRSYRKFVTIISAAGSMGPGSIQGIDRAILDVKRVLVRPSLFLQLFIFMIPTLQFILQNLEYVGRCSRYAQRPNAVQSKTKLLLPIGGVIISIVVLSVASLLLVEDSP